MGDTNMRNEIIGALNHDKGNSKSQICEIQLFVGDPFGVEECDSGTNGAFDRPSWRDLGIFFDSITKIVGLAFGSEPSEIGNTRRLFREENGKVAAGAAISIPAGSTQAEIDELRARVELLLKIMRKPAEITQNDIILGDEASSSVASVAQEILQIHGGKIISQPVRIEMPSTNHKPLIFSGKIAPKPVKQAFASPNPIVIKGVLDALFRSERKILVRYEKENSKSAKISIRIEIERDWKKLISIFNPPVEAEFIIYEMVTPAFKLEFRLDEIQIDGSPFNLGS